MDSLNPTYITQGAPLQSAQRGLSQGHVEAFILKRSIETKALFYKSIIYQLFSYNHLENKIVLTVSRLTFKRIRLTSSAHTWPRRATQDKSPEFKCG